MKKKTKEEEEEEKKLVGPVDRVTIKQKQCSSWILYYATQRQNRPQKSNLYSKPWVWAIESPTWGKNQRAAAGSESPFAHPPPYLHYILTLIALQSWDLKSGDFFYICRTSTHNHLTYNLTWVFLRRLFFFFPSSSSLLFFLFFTLTAQERRLTPSMFMQLKIWSVQVTVTWTLGESMDAICIFSKFPILFSLGFSEFLFLFFVFDSGMINRFSILFI